MRAWMAALLIAGSLFVAAADVAAQPVPMKPPPDTTVIEGQAQIIVVGAFALAGKRVMLHGIDPVMRNMPCGTDRGRWDCYAAGLRILLNLIGREPISCTPRGVDLFQRVFAKCEVHGQDIALALVEAGMALAIPEETTEYVEAEKQAKAKKAGIWRGDFLTPADYRTFMSGDPQPR